MTKLQIPSFDPTDHIVGTEAEFNKELNKGQNNFIKEPGEYVLSVADIEVRGVSEKDENWFSTKFTLENAEGAKFNYFQLFPRKRVNNFKYGPKKTTFVYKGLMDFMRGFGINLEFETAMGTLAKVYEDITVLQDKKITVILGYTGPYVAYKGKSIEGNNQYVIINKGTPVLDEEGSELIFPDWRAAENYAAGVSLKLQKFMEMVNIRPGKALKVEEVEEEEETLPFL